ncbi:MAG: hypothetical protein HYY09_07915 [Firmicutes bacterium]|nr:hypothetical protein [Bacillota bacterium]
MKPEPIYVGIDVGSASVNIVGVDPEGLVAGQAVYVRIADHDSPVTALKEGFRLFLSSLGDDSEVSGIGTTGSGRELNRHIVGGDLTRTEIFAHAVGIVHLAGMGLVRNTASEIITQAGTIIEIGGQDSKVIVFDEHGIPCYFNMNSICSAGTGEFLQQLADEAGIPIEEFGPMALRAEMPARIDATCTVFSKRDFRHLTQKGVPLPDRLAGICQAMVNNYYLNVVGSYILRTPVIFQGGVASNVGVVRAFESRLGMPVIVPPYHKVMGALGMAVVVRDHCLGRESFATSFKEDFFERDYQSRVRYCHGCRNACEVTQPLEIESGGGVSVLDNLGGRCERCHDPGNVREEPQGLEKAGMLVHRAAGERGFDVLSPGPGACRDGDGVFFAGIDGGSRGTKYALVRSHGGGGSGGSASGARLEIVDVGTVDTAGDAVAAVRSAVRSIGEVLPAGAVLGGIGTTGSAGELARDMITTRVDECSDYRSTEIIAHYAWAAHLFPEVRTVMDIGGNDSKIIVVKDGGLDFAMNDKCAAGTGSFIEAVARRFDVPLEGFAARALSSVNPARVAGRCAVFGESDLIHKARVGFPVEDLLMGLCFAISRTYLSDVAKGKPLRAPIVAQGGTFLNEGVREAFRRTLGLGEDEFVVHQDPRFVVGAGALGAALLARTRFQQGYDSHFKGFGAVAGNGYQTVSTTCNVCPKRCRGVVALLENGQPIAGYRSIDCDFGLFDGLIAGLEERQTVQAILETAA